MQQTRRTLLATSASLLAAGVAGCGAGTDEELTETADGDGETDDADYCASSDFDSEQTARDGWEEGQGAVQSGQSFVHTFETTGTHEYVCIPHEAASMVGSVTVE